MSNMFDALESRVFLSAMPYSLYASEGYAGEGISEYVPMFNPNGVDIQYEVWAHFEVGERDLLLTSGTLRAGFRGGEVLSDSANPDASLVPTGRPYAVEIRSTLPITADLTRYDRGQTGEAFTYDPNYSWVFPEVTLDGGNVEQYLTWFNTSDQQTNVVVRVIDRTSIDEQPAFSPVEVRVSTDAMRRGGLSLSDVPALAGLTGSVSIELVADAPIVSMYAEYFGERGASLTLGSPSTGTNEAYFPVVFAPAALSDASQVSITNTSGAPTEITVTLTPIEGNGIQRTLTVAAGRSVTFGISELLPQGAASFTGSLALRGFGFFHAQVTTGDLSTNASEFASSTLTPGSLGRQFIAEGFMDPARAGVDLFSTFTLYIPPTPLLGSQLVVPFIGVSLHFGDGSSLELAELASPGSHNLHEMDELLAHIGDNAERRFFSIMVVSNTGTKTVLQHQDRFHTAFTGDQDSFFVQGVDAQYINTINFPPIPPV